mgnify:FL=1
MSDEGGRSATETLFSYGTLREEDVQRRLFGRSLASQPDALVGYRLRMIRIEDADFVALSGAEMHRTLEHTGASSDRVEGCALALTREDLSITDDYEPAGYERTLVTLASGAEAWLYVKAVGAQVE